MGADRAPAGSRTGSYDVSDAHGECSAVDVTCHSTPSAVLPNVARGRISHLPSLSRPAVHQNRPFAGVALSSKSADEKSDDPPRRGPPDQRHAALIKGLRLPQDMTETHPQNRRLGYARISTYGQTLDSQLEQLRAAGCTTKIFREKVMGARPDRRELLKLLKHLAPGDVVTVTRIDRLARSTFDLFAIVKQIVDAKAQFRSLAEPWADTAPTPGA
jgi:hypothetical protein